MLLQNKIHDFTRVKISFDLTRILETKIQGTELISQTSTLKIPTVLFLQILMKPRLTMWNAQRLVIDMSASWY